MKVTNNYDHPPPSQHTLTKEESRKLPSSKLLLPDVYSAFYPSNETFNVWTHFIPLLFLIWRTAQIYSSLVDPFEKITHPFWIQSFGSCLVLLTSSFAHLFSCYSVIGQEICFCLDYGMIPVFGVSTTISMNHYSCPFKCYGFLTNKIPEVYTVLTLFMSVFGTYITCLSRYPNCPLKYVYRFGPFALCFVLGNFPCVIRYFSNDSSIIKGEQLLPRHCTLGENYHQTFQMQFFFFLMAILFVGFRFPEKWFAGTFDIVGHSHQWFHICVAAGIYQLHLTGENAMREAIQLRDQKEINEESLSISAWTTFAPLIFLLFVLPLFVYQTSKNVGEIVEKNRRKKV